MSTILLVDSQRISRHYLVALLGSCGHGVIEAEDGVEALEMLGRSNPDLIISDVLMRMMDGYEFVEQLRARPAPAPPIMFFVHASYARVAQTDAAACGVQHVIAKASEPELILATVDDALSSEHKRRTAPSKMKFDRLRLIPPVDPIDANASVFVVDDDPALRRLLSAVMAWSNLKVQTFASPQEFLDAYRDQPGCLLTDLLMPGMSGVAMLAALRARRSHIPTIIMTGQGDLADAKLAMRLGVVDFLDKSVARRTLLARVYTALQEDANQRHDRAEAEKNQQRLASLTARERELVKLLIEGRASKEIAANLNISVKTVGIHRAHLMAKTGATNVADLVRMSMMAGDVQ